MGGWEKTLKKAEGGGWDGGAWEEGRLGKRITFEKQINKTSNKN